MFQTTDARCRQLKVEANLMPARQAAGLGRNKFDAEFEELLRFLHERVQAFDRAGKGGGGWKEGGPRLIKSFRWCCVSS